MLAIKGADYYIAEASFPGGDDAMRLRHLSSRSRQGGRHLAPTGPPGQEAVVNGSARRRWRRPPSARSRWPDAWQRHR